MKPEMGNGAQSKRSFFLRFEIGKLHRLKQTVTKALRSGVSLAIGRFILAVGFILLSLMFVSILATYTPLPIWASLGIVALVYCIAGAMVLWAGTQKASRVKPFPEQSVRS